MKYRKIERDTKITDRLLRTNKAELARRLGVSKGYIWQAYKERFVVSEELYEKIKQEALEMLIEKEYENMRSKKGTTVMVYDEETGEGKITSI